MIIKICGFAHCDTPLSYGRCFKFNPDSYQTENLTWVFNNECVCACRMEMCRLKDDLHPISR